MTASRSLTNSRSLTAYDGAGDASPPAATGYVTLDADSHYFPIPMADLAELQGLQIITDATIAGTFTIEACNVPERRGGSSLGPADVTDYDETSGNWVQINLAAAGYAQGVGTGWSITVLSLVKTAGAGGAIVNLAPHPSRRLRLKAAITTGGTVRVVAHGKG